MKNNTEKAKALVSQAIREMPQDFALSEARYHLNIALQQIQKVEQKRIHRAEQDKIQTERYWPSMSPSVNVKDTLQAIDDMITAEQRKIKDITEKKRKQEDDDISPILG